MFPVRRRREGRRCRGRVPESRPNGWIGGNSQGGRCTVGEGRQVAIGDALLRCRRGIRCISLLRQRSGGVLDREGESEEVGEERSVGGGWLVK